MRRTCSNRDIIFIATDSVGKSCLLYLGQHSMSWPDIKSTCMHTVEEQYEMTHVHVVVGSEVVR